MGNPVVNIDAAASAASAPDTGNGILAFVSGAQVSQAMQGLPACGADQPAKMTADVDVPGRGRVRITFERKRYRHYRNTFWIWTASRADLV